MSTLVNVKEVTVNELNGFEMTHLMELKDLAIEVQDLDKQFTYLYCLPKAEDYNINSLEDIRELMLKEFHILENMKFQYLSEYREISDMLIEVMEKASTMNQQKALLFLGENILTPLRKAKLLLKKAIAEAE